jgi:hypothetical protein
MRLRREAFALAALASLTVLLGACAAPASNTEVASTEAAAPRDCEPQTGTRVPASCTKARATRSTTAAAEGGQAPATKQ